MGIKYPASSGASTASGISFSPRTNDNILTNEDSVAAALNTINEAEMDVEEYEAAVRDSNWVNNQATRRIPDMTVINQLNCNLSNVRVKVPCAGTTSGTNEIYFVIPNDFDPNAASYDIHLEFSAIHYTTAPPVSIEWAGNELKATYSSLEAIPTAEYYVIISKV